VEELDASGNPTGKATEITYDQKGNVTGSTVVTTEDGEKVEKTYKPEDLNDDGTPKDGAKPTQVTITDKDDVEKVYDGDVLDEDGNVPADAEPSSVTNPDGSSTKTVTDADGKQQTIETTVEKDGDKTTTTETVKDENGNVIGQTVTTVETDGDKTTTTQTNYDGDPADPETKISGNQTVVEGNTATQTDYDGKPGDENASVTGTTVVVTEQGKTTETQYNGEISDENKTKETETQYGKDGKTTVTETGYDEGNEIVKTVTEIKNGEEVKISETHENTPILRFKMANGDATEAKPSGDNTKMDNFESRFSEDKTKLIAGNPDAACAILAKRSSDGSYVRLKATSNGDGTYSFDLPDASNGGYSLVVTKLGDVDGDGNVDISDIARIILERRSNDGQTLARIMSDVNNDDSIDVSDIADLIRCRRATADAPVAWF
jgi:hypothetical protein